MLIYNLSVKGVILESDTLSSLRLSPSLLQSRLCQHFTRLFLYVFQWALIILIEEPLCYWQEAGLN